LPHLPTGVPTSDDDGRRRPTSRCDDECHLIKLIS
jgi:hypothetical protein